MNMHEIIDKNSERIERKIILSKGQIYSYKYQLKDIGFSIVNAERKVSSIYFDNADYSNLNDNIDGNRLRNKLRVRYYNDNLQKSSIEIKQKRGYVGYKHRINIFKHFKNDKELINYLNSWAQKKINNIIIPVSKVTYKRSYYVKGPIRLTIDKNVTSHRLSSLGKKLYSSINDYEVIEFKYHPSFDEHFRDIFSKFNQHYVRTTKSSKYSNSLMY